MLLRLAVSYMASWPAIIAAGLVSAICWVRYVKHFSATLKDDEGLFLNHHPRANGRRNLRDSWLVLSLGATGWFTTFFAWTTSADVRRDWYASVLAGALSVVVPMIAYGLYDVRKNGGLRLPRRSYKNHPKLHIHRLR